VKDTTIFSLVGVTVFVLAPDKSKTFSAEELFRAPAGIPSVQALTGAEDSPVFKDYREVAVAENSASNTENVSGDSKNPYGYGAYDYYNEGDLDAQPQMEIASAEVDANPSPSVSETVDSGKLEYAAGADLLGDKLVVFQGDYKSLGATVDEVAKKLAAFDVLVLSHVSTKNTSNGCIDTAYPQMKELIYKVRRVNKKKPMRIFGYTSATADAPGSGCGADVMSSYGSWSCSGGTCSQFTTWVDEWLAIEDKENEVWLDGIMIDLVNPVIISSVVRDNVFSYVRGKGKHIMTNITVPNKESVEFTANSSYFGTLGKGDYVLMEQFIYGLGKYTSDSEINTVAALDSWSQLKQNKPFSVAALATEAWGAIASCTAPNHGYAYKKYLGYFNNGNAFSYTGGDLGIASKVITDCDHSGMISG